MRKKTSKASSRQKQSPIGYCYLTRITTSKGTRWYCGKRESPVFVSNYHGSGTAVRRIKKARGKAPFKTEVMGWAYSDSELRQLEEDLIAWTKAEYGKRCVNINDASIGFTSEGSRLRWSDPRHRAKCVAAIREVMATPEYRAKIAATKATPEYRAKIVAAVATPEYRAKRAATMSTPEFKARRSAASKKAQSRPAVRAKIAATQATPESKAKYDAARNALLAASLPLRVEAKALRVRAKAEGITLPASPRASGTAEAWQVFVDAARTLVPELDSRDLLRGECRVAISQLGCAGIPRPRAPHRDAPEGEWKLFLLEARHLLATAPRNPPARRSLEARIAYREKRAKENQPLIDQFYDELVSPMVQEKLSWPSPPKRYAAYKKWQQHLQTCEQLLARARRKPVRVENLMAIA